MGLYRTQGGALVEADLQSEAKRPTFKKARDAILEYLKKKGWKVVTWGPSGQLKVPHATAPYMHGPKLWFKTQAVYISGAKDKFNDARSTWDDIRDMTPEQFVKGIERTFRESVLGDGPVLTEASAQIKVYPFKHPHTSWKDPSRVSLKVRKGDMSPADFKAALKQAGIELHPEFPKIITGGVYEIAIVSKKDWEAHGQKVQTSAKAAPKAEPKKKEPMSLEGMKLSPTEIKLLHKIHDAEIGPLYGGHPAPGDLTLNPKHDMQKINLVAGMMGKKWKDTDGKQKALLSVHSKDWSWVGGPYDKPQIVTLKTAADVHKAAKKGDTIYVSTNFSTWAGSGKTTHDKFFWQHKKVHGH